MVQNGEWVIPQLYLHPQKSTVQLQPFLEKPPLVFWLQGVSMSLFGVTRFAARLPVAICAILSLMVGTTVAIVLPWALYAWLQYGQEFIYQIFLHQVLSRATGEAFLSYSGTLFSFMRYPYFQELPSMFEPWLVLLFPAIIGAVLWGLKRDRLGTPLFLCWWALSTLGFYAVTGNHGWYIMPMFVPCALLIGMGGDVIGEEYPKLIVASAFAVVVVILQEGATVGTMLLGIGFLICAGRRELREKISGMLSEQQATALFRIVPIVLAGALIIVLVGGVPVGDGVSYNEPEQLGRATNQHVPTGTSVAIGPGVSNEFAFSFYAQHPLTDFPEGEFANAEQGQYIVVSGEAYSQLGGAYETVYEGRRYALVRKTTG